MSAPRGSGLSRRALDWLGWIASPALAGAAFSILCLGIITWLPALAAVGFALNRWRTDGDTRCFTGVFVGWRRYWRQLLPHSTPMTVAVLIAASNLSFLSGRSGPLVLALFMIHVGLIAAAITYHLALAVAAGRNPSGSATEWRRTAFRLAFTSVPRGTALLGAAVSAPVFSLVVPAGPLLLGTTVPVLVGLLVADRA
ncbi:DUF624 domain-containing protein [Kribbella shirazensis]|uniref:DUF624 domain-containing protein n=1 Tax=Kribbella shirazensis TaxID=1105143 RepID=A0A7X5V9M8_9ACTN|nr:DUF624 domain-containing protein [Kribbella shirazensis]NIK56393.1 hypothetical protein [Kribbella shirazensis]